MKRSSKPSSVSGLAALLLLCVFSVGMLSVLLGGAKVYRRLTQRDDLAYNSRTATQYLATKVRQSSVSGAVSVSRFGDSDALLLSEANDGEEYLSRIYCHDGWLMELFTAAEGDFAPEDGEKILEARNLSLSLDSGLLSICLTDAQGTLHEQKLFLRGEGNGP